MSEVHQLARLVQQKLESYLKPGSLVLVAVSGGADSVALLRLLQESGFGLVVAHLDHALREDSVTDADFVRDLAEKLTLPVFMERVEVARVARSKKGNLEAVARMVRYAFLSRIAKRVGAAAIVTAHTKNDQAETVLMQLLRGASYLRGMSERRRHVIRPLLAVSRDQLLAYLEDVKQGYQQDSSNFDISRTRAWLRHELLPMILQRFPQALTQLGQHSAFQQELAAFMQQLAQPYLDDEGIRLRQLRKQPVALQREAISQALAQRGLRREWGMIDSLYAATKKRQTSRISLSPEVLARVSAERIDLVRSSSHVQQPRLVTSAADLPADISENVLQYPKLVYRSRLPGDRIRLSAGTKKLSDLLIDLKVPREERDSLPLLASGATVLWVKGVAVAEGLQKEINDDSYWMHQALLQAQLAAKCAEVPVGAVIVRQGEAIATAHNQTESLRDAAAHAEVLAIREASRKLGDWRLTDCTLYVTLEPCPMCFGLLLQAHLPTLVFAASNHREGAVGTVVDLQNYSWKHQVTIRSGVLAQEAAELLEQFFMAKRVQQSHIEKT